MNALVELSDFIIAKLRSEFGFKFEILEAIDPRFINYAVVTNGHSQPHLAFHQKDDACLIKYDVMQPLSDLDVFVDCKNCGQFVRQRFCDVVLEAEREYSRNQKTLGASTNFVGRLNFEARGVSKPDSTAAQLSSSLAEMASLLDARLVITPLLPVEKLEQYSSSARDLYLEMRATITFELIPKKRISETAICDGIQKWLPNIQQPLLHKRSVLGTDLIPGQDVLMMMARHYQMLAQVTLD